MGIPINRNFTKALIARRWNGIDDLAEGWAERVEDGLQKSGRARDRATIYRWLSRGLQNRRDEVFGFAAVLGVDPLVLLDTESAEFQKLIKREWFFFLANLEGRGAYSALWQLVRPSAHWPNAGIAHDFYARQWSTIEFRHPADAQRNIYAQIHLGCESDDQQAHVHRVYYFAYRRIGARDGLWRPYGMVRKRGLEATCLGHNGDANENEHGLPARLALGRDGTIDVETFFGPGPSEFKVACLHPFALEVIVPSRATSSLRFPA